MSECSTLCHPEEPCSINENGNCKIKGEVMNKEKHTPGPWFAKGRYVENEDYIICETFGVNRVNVNLIAAAPELLEALERIINDDRAAVDRDDYLFAKEAIAKAKGE